MGAVHDHGVGRHGGDVDTGREVVEMTAAAYRTVWGHLQEINILLSSSGPGRRSISVIFQENL